MAKFSEIIGGIAKDLVQVQVSSDLASLEVLDLYKKNEIWKNLSIPRFTLSDVGMKLKFAISEETTLKHTEESVKLAEAEWLGVLKGQILNDILASNRTLSVVEKKKIQAEFEKASSSLSKPDLDMKNALSAKTHTTVVKSTNYIMEVHKKLSAATRKKLPPDSSLKKLVQDKVAVMFESRMPVLKKVASAKAVVERDLDIIIEKAELEKIDNQQIHEISFNLTPDYINFIQDEAAK